MSWGGTDSPGEGFGTSDAGAPSRDLEVQSFGMDMSCDASGWSFAKVRGCDASGWSFARVRVGFTHTEQRRETANPSPGGRTAGEMRAFFSQRFSTLGVKEVARGGSTHVKQRRETADSPPGGRTAEEMLAFFLSAFRRLA